MDQLWQLCNPAGHSDSAQIGTIFPRIVVDEARYPVVTSPVSNIGREQPAQAASANHDETFGWAHASDCSARDSWPTWSKMESGLNHETETAARQDRTGGNDVRVQCQVERK